MKLGADDPKKVIVLVGLVAVAGYLKFSDVFSSSPSPAVSSTVAQTREGSTPAAETRSARPAGRRTRLQSDDFNPVLHSKRPEDRIDPAKYDPTLRLDLLAKVQQAEPTTAGRNIFQFGAEPLPPEPKVVLKPGPAAAAAPPKPAAPTGPPEPPPPPPITLRYYCFTSQAGSSAKTAFFLDGEEILVAKEGETLKRRYRVVRIGATSVVMEDTQSKRQQTIPLAEELAG